MNTDMKLKVTEIQRFCMHDGPGIRTTVFLKGCPLRCEWCHNPETQKNSSELLFYKNKCIGCGGCVASCPSGAQIIEDIRGFEREKCILCFECSRQCPAGALEVCGEDMSVDEILAIVEKDSAFYGEKGGITLSGGEPLWQKESTSALLSAAKEKGLHTVMETCGYGGAEFLKKVIPFVDLFLWDIKDTDPARHKQYTGVTNEKILKNLALADAGGAKIRLRCILVNGVNTDENHYRRIADIASSLSNCEGVEFIPYHSYAGTKAVFIGAEDTGRKEWIPTPEQIDEAKSILRNENIFVI